MPLKQKENIERTHYVIPKAFIAAVIGSEKNTGSTRYTMSPDTSRKFRLFSSGSSLEALKDGQDGN